MALLVDHNRTGGKGGIRNPNTDAFRDYMPRPACGGGAFLPTRAGERRSARKSARDALACPSPRSGRPVTLENRGHLRSGLPRPRRAGSRRSNPRVAGRPAWRRSWPFFASPCSPRRRAALRLAVPARRRRLRGIPPRRGGGRPPAADRRFCSSSFPATAAAAAVPAGALSRRSLLGGMNLAAIHFVAKFLPGDCRCTLATRPSILIILNNSGGGRRPFAAGRKT